jgi:hypothetical protein
MKRFLVKQLKPFLDHAYTRIAVGLILISSAVLDMADLAIERALGFELGIEHGMVIFGVFTVARALHDVADGLELVGLEKEMDQLRVASDLRPPATALHGQAAEQSDPRMLANRHE